MAKSKSSSRSGRMIETYVAKVPPAPESTRPSKSASGRIYGGKKGKSPSTERAAG